MAKEGDKEKLGLDGVSPYRIPRNPQSEIRNPQLNYAFH
jgi:hypothetical protein